MKEIKLTDIKGFRIGHAEYQEAMTGCSVMLFDKATTTGVDIRGGGPASRETPLLSPVANAKGIHAVLLSGGSAYGLDAAGGVMHYLEERGIGYDVGGILVPLVCQSCIFDLKIGDSTVRPDATLAYAACENAVKDESPMLQGSVGVGLGCTVGKYKGADYRMKSGIGSYAVRLGDLEVGAFVAVNALGDIYDPDTGKKIAGAKDETGKLDPSELSFFESFALEDQSSLSDENTTLGIIVTNAAFDKAGLTKIASMAHNGFARAIRPVHTMADGDCIYAASLGDKTYDISLVGALSAHVMSKAIARACSLPPESKKYR